MRYFGQCLGGLALLALGYLMGTSDVGQADLSAADDAKVVADADVPSAETSEKIKTTAQSLSAAQAALQQEGRYTPAIKSVNPFAVMVGGVNAMRDLEEGRGVDPDTFVGLYTGQEVAELAPHLGYDEARRRTYKNKVITLYPISRLRELTQQRSRLMGEKIDDAKPRPAAIISSPSGGSSEPRPAATPRPSTPKAAKATTPKMPKARPMAKGRAAKGKTF